jgi:hypothetical protein
VKTLRLRVPSAEDEAAVLKAHHQMLKEGFTFATGLEEKNKTESGVWQYSMSTSTEFGVSKFIGIRLTFQ